MTVISSLTSQMSQLASMVSKLESKLSFLQNMMLQMLNPPTMDKAKDEELHEIFKKVEINLPLLSAVQQIPMYAKFLKELCTKKRRHSDKENIIAYVNEGNVSFEENRVLDPCLNMTVSYNFRRR
ncbi:uncharacterized protein E5676_scaffold111G00800 [Cucumis melo var. makuwa]|uniref:Retrotransposon gag protein n=1 Tax=Cucumis melo var. makuwa TaxID=1194695 RepID=A0A5A7UYJ3_CUCMM|nr:uncharacterized protein E6C27_scaffold54G001800 [Cucumis melo var. makuwa]TYK26155.1 uncharacterized protein E5676_scaffold111G00800 [Cucumis melo var. makuwa]